MPRKSADNRKTEIVSAVLRLADELGPDRLTTLAVADAVGVTQPAIFRHFPTKQALWAAVGESMGQRMEAAWEDVLAGTSCPDGRLAALIACQLGQIAANPAIPAILHSRELQVENAALRDVFRALMMRFQTLLEDELAAAQAAGLARRDIDAKDGAILLVSLVQGLAIRWSLGNRAFALTREGARLVHIQLRLLGFSVDGGENDDPL